MVDIVKNVMRRFHGGPWSNPNAGSGSEVLLISLALLSLQNVPSARGLQSFRHVNAKCVIFFFVGKSFENEGLGAY